MRFFTSRTAIRRILFASIAIAALASLAFGIHSRNSIDAKSRDKVHVTLASPPLLYSSLLYLAKDEGFFDREGVEVTWITTTTGKEALDMVLGGKADFALAATLPLTKVILKGATPRILATIASTGHDSVVVARTDRAIGRIADLQGKTIGVTLGTSAQFYLEALLIDAGISPSSVNLVDLSPAACVENLATGKVDAVSAFFPWSNRASQALGEGGIKFSPELDVTHWNLLASKSPSTRSADGAARLLRALRAAESLAVKQPDRAIAATASNISVPVEDVAVQWKRYKFHVHLPQSLVIALENETRWTHARDTAAPRSATMPNFLDYIDSTALRALDPMSVKITE